jgi:PII-like signaling protein
MRVQEGEQFLMRIFVNEGDKIHGKALYHEIVDVLRNEKAAGATVVRAIAGFGADTKLHTASILTLSKDLPIIIEVIDTEENISKMRPKVEEVITEGIITLEKVHVAKYSKK